MHLTQPSKPTLADTSFSIERTAQRERIRMPARLQVGQTVLSLLIGTLAMGTGLMQLWPGEPDGLDVAQFAMFIVPLALGLISVALWRMGGSVTMEMSEGNLRVTRWLFGLHHVTDYAVDGISDMASKIGSDEAGIWDVRVQDGFFARPDQGAVQFDYRGKTISLAPGFGEAEGAAIVRWLRGKLPQSAFAV